MKNKQSIIIQIILGVIAAILGIISIFDLNFMIYLQIALAFLLFIMAYNNEIIYKRKGMTYFYIGVGIVLVIAVITGMINEVVRIY